MRFRKRLIDSHRADVPTGGNFLETVSMHGKRDRSRLYERKERKDGLLPAAYESVNKKAVGSKE